MSHKFDGLGRFETIAALIDRDGFACAYCGVGLLHREPGESPNPKVDPRPFVTIDHVVPRVLGGEDTLANACLACPSCNFDKGRLSAAEWRAVITYRRRHAIRAVRAARRRYCPTVRHTGGGPSAVLCPT